MQARNQWRTKIVARPTVFIGLFLFTVLLTYSGSGFSADNTGMEQESLEYGVLTPLRGDVGVSLAPIIAYEPTFGMIYGGAVFLERELLPQYNFGTILAFSMESEYSVVLNLKKWVSEDTYFHLELDVDNFARPYYGEGMDTDPSERIDLEGTVHQFRYLIKFFDKSKISFGPHLEYRGTIPGDVIGNDLAPPEYREATLGLGMCLFYDTRDSELNPASGTFDNLTIRYVPDYLSNSQGSDTFFQADLDSRIYYSPAPGTVLAGRVHLAGSWGEPSYQYRYWLGGPYELRGFSTNRFRGESMYVVQGEVRQKLFGRFTGAAFAEVGEATDHSFHSPETSYGGGFRMTLPPDHVAKLRIDFAWAKDEHSIYFVFGGAF